MTDARAALLATPDSGRDQCRVVVPLEAGPVALQRARATNSPEAHNERFFANGKLVVGDAIAASSSSATFPSFPDFPILPENGIANPPRTPTHLL